MYEKYKKEDIIIESPHTMLTSVCKNGVIIITVYSRNAVMDLWVVDNDFRITPKAFENISNNMTFLVASYVRDLFRIEDKVD
jgi:hypothetical protein